MPENEIEKTENEPVKARRSLRNLALLGGVFLGGIVLITAVGLFAYWYGTFDRYVKSEFTAKMSDIGFVFDADVFSLTASPFELHLKNATFNDLVTGEKLFFIGDARLGLSVRDVFAWQLRRDISIDSTEIDGAEAWINFDENGNSNFSNLTLVEQEDGAINFRYDTVTFSLRNGTIHAGDISRKVSGDAKNLIVNVSPEDADAEKKRYKADLTATDSKFVYDGSPLEPIDIWAKAVVYAEGADITEIKIESPIGVTTLNGTVNDWASLKYELNVESTVDLTQTSNTFPLGTTLRGVGNFKGKVSGEGETYSVEGTVDSQALAADNIYLKAINVEGTVAGTNANYEANGKAVAELLTFDDFRIEFPRLAGNVRGTGTDFRWVGELQAAAVKSGSLTFGNLFLADAVAENNDRGIAVSAPIGRTQKFSINDNEFAELTARNFKFATKDGMLNIDATSATSKSFTTPNYRIDGITGREISVENANKQTSVDVKDLTAESAQLKSNKVSNLRARSFAYKNRPDGTDIKLSSVAAAEVDANGTHISGVESPLIEINNSEVDTKIYANDLRVAKIVGGGAELGSLNIAGVRLSLREGRVEGSSNDIDAGTIALLKTETLPDGGKVENVKIVKPVFVIEPSGRYRASFDMSIGGGTVGSIPLGNATAAVDINNDRVDLRNLNGQMMNGAVNGNATIAFNSKTASKIDLAFANLDLETVLALQSGAVLPLKGKTTGSVDLAFQGTDLKTASGKVKADINADAGSASEGSIPVNGNVELTAANGLFNVDLAQFKTAKSDLKASGQFDLRASNTDLQLALNSTDATEIERIFRSLDFAPQATETLDSIQASIPGDLAFSGKLTGQVSDPTFDGRASVGTFAIRGKPVGSVTTAINVSPLGVNLSDGKLHEFAGGSATFEITAPRGGTNNTSIDAKLTRINTGDLLAALPIGFFDRFGSIQGQTTGSVDLAGLPDLASGSIDLVTANGSIVEQAFQNLLVKADFDGAGKVTLDSSMTASGGTLRADGIYDTQTAVFDLDVESEAIPLPLIVAVLPPISGVSSVAGLVDIKGRINGDYDDISTYSANFGGSARGVVINDEEFGNVTLKGSTTNQVFSAEIIPLLDGKPQPINATLNFGDENLPFRVESVFDQSPLGPFFALVPQLRGIEISGNGTGTVRFGGNISSVDSAGTRIYSTENLTGDARFSSLALRVQETPLEATEPVVILFNPREVVFESAKFAGGGSNVVIAGTKSISAEGRNDLSVIGRINLALLNVFRPVKTSDTFFGGIADVSIRLTGPSADSKLSGSADLENASVATFIGSDRFTFDRLNGKILFASNQAQIESMTGYLGGGKFTATGGALFTDDLNIDAYRVSLNGSNVTIPYPKDFITTGDAAIEVTGKRIGAELTTLISGNIRARRSLYSKDIDLATVVGGRRDGSLSTGGSSLSAPRLDLTIEGRNALIVQNNIADLTASVALRVTGNAENPQISGRIVADSGQIFFRRERYDIQRAVLEFPPNTDIDPRLSLQAEAQIGGYQVFVNLNGPLTDTEQLNASVRSSPALPQADVISLITTGSLSNTDSGIPTLAATGINTAAEVLTDSIINNPVRKATDRLFGLNVFEIDPIISGERANPTARLTVGRQINNNLRVTYSTNLSQDQNQVLAFEYRVSSNFSFVAQYEQRSLSNVTRSRDNFSFGVRFRRRF
ncbi:MAG: translocation/assembly module TamB domain-containing protein [Pyrinomonadaceae bacterium]